MLAAWWELAPRQEFFCPPSLVAVLATAACPAGSHRATLLKTKPSRCSPVQLLTDFELLNMACWSAVSWVGVTQRLGRKLLIWVTFPSQNLTLTGTLPGFPFSGWRQLAIWS